MSSISLKHIYLEIIDIYKKYENNHSKFYSQIISRIFFKYDDIFENEINNILEDLFDNCIDGCDDIQSRSEKEIWNDVKLSIEKIKK